MSWHASSGRPRSRARRGMPTMKQGTVEEVDDPALVLVRSGTDPAGVFRAGDLPDLLGLAGPCIVDRASCVLSAQPGVCVDQEHRARCDPPDPTLDRRRRTVVREDGQRGGHECQVRLRKQTSWTGYVLVADATPRSFRD